MRRSLIQLIERDILLSLRSATIRTLLPLGVYAALYPWLLREMGPRVLGLWSLFASVPAMAGLVDFGIPQLLSRSGHWRGAASLAKVRWIDVRGAELLYVLIGVLFAATAHVTIYFAFPDIEIGDYSAGRLVFNSWLVGLGLAALLIARLHGAILASCHENHAVHFGFALQPAITAGCTALGLLAHRPIEGFALGMFLSSLHLRWWFLRRWTGDESAPTVSLRSAIARLRTRIRQGRGLYWANAALAAREPLLRAAIAAIGGLSAAAAYEIASRVTRVARDMAGAPFASLLTGFSSLWAGNEQGHIIRLSLISLATMVTVGGGFLVLATGGISVAGASWLGVPPPGVVPATALLSAWHLLTLFNVPYWHLLLATKQEVVALRAVMFHTGALIVAVPVLAWTDSGLTATLAFWLVASIATQHFIFRAASRTLGVRYASLFGTALAWPLLVLAVFTLSTAVVANLLSTRPLAGVLSLVALGALYFYIQHLTLKRIDRHPALLGSARNAPDAYTKQNDD